MRKKINLNVILLLFAAPFNFTVYGVGRMLAANSPHFNITSPLDRYIPLIPWTILIYWVLGFALWIINYTIGTLRNVDGRRFIVSHYLGEIVCFVVFVLFPTTMDRPEIQVSTIFDRLLALTYQVDKADNLLPSIHCYASWLCWIAVRKNPYVSRWYRFFSLASAVAICISTMTVKQHVIVDVITGIGLAELSYFVAGKIRFLRAPESTDR